VRAVSDDFDDALIYSDRPCWIRLKIGHISSGSETRYKKYALSIFELFEDAQNVHGGACVSQRILDNAIIFFNVQPHYDTSNDPMVGRFSWKHRKRFARHRFPLAWQLHYYEE